MKNTVKMKKLQIKSTFVLVLVFTLLSVIVFAVSTTLQSPANNFVDDDGFLDLRASCNPGYDGTTSYNITKATLYSDLDGTWKEDNTLQVTIPIANATYYFNFTNSIIQVAEREIVWNVQCYEANSSNDGANINEAFTGNRTVKVEYSLATVTTVSPVGGSHDSDGQNILIDCLATPTSGWNLTQIDLMTNVSSNWVVSQTFIIPTRSVGTQFSNGFLFNLDVGSEVTQLIFSCSSTQIKNDLIGSPSSEKSSPNRTLNIGASCSGNVCDTIGQKWCEDGLWKEGTYFHYCSRCGYADSACPVCENDICDTNDKKWCNTGAWSTVDYCSSCGNVDSSCGVECQSSTCDTENRRWCNDGVWDESNYCISCGTEDSICSFTCQENACDIKNKKWCDNGAWSQTD